MENKITTKLVDIDLSVLLKKEPKLIPDNLVELKMIEFYKLYQTEENSIFNLFTKYLLKILYKDEEDHDINDIYMFYKDSFYNHVIMEFNNLIDLKLYLDTKEYNPINIEYDSILSKTEDKLLVRFKITTGVRCG